MAYLRLSSRSGIARPLVKLVRFQTTVTTTQDVESNNVRPFEDIPGPKGLPFFGSVHRYMQKGGFQKMFNVQKELFQEYGPIFKETLFGRTGVHILDPKDCEKVFRSEGKYPYRIPVESWVRYKEEKGYYKGILISQGTEWHRNRRAMATKMLTPKQVVYDNIENFYGVVDDAMVGIRKARGEGKTSGEVPTLDQEMFKFATESVGTMVFDVRIGLYEDPPRPEPQLFIKSVLDFVDSTQRIEMGFEKSFYKYFDTPGWKTMQKSLDAILGIGQKYVDLKIAELKDQLDDPEELLNGKVPLLTHLLAKKELTPHEINMSAIEMFMAGVDTTSNTTLWLLYCLARNPEAQERVHEEIVSVTGKDGYLTAKDMGRISYLKACLKESMRMHPTFISNARILDEDIVLSGYNVPAKTLIQPSIYAAGHSEQLFEAPEEFRPERWLRDTGDDIQAFSHLPFGFGPRMCNGRRVAELEIYLFLSKLVQQFRLEYHREPVKSHMKLLIVPEDPIVINFVDRNA